MKYTLNSLDLRGKKIINTENGKIIAAVNDVLFDPEADAIAALVTSKAGLFNRTTEIVQRKDIVLLGEDVILADHADIVMDKNDISVTDQWLSVSDRLQGLSVVTTEGTRVGKLQDLVVDEKGNLTALAVTDMNGRKMQEIAYSALRNIGKDAIIIEPVAEEQPAEMAEQPQTTPSNTVGVFNTDQPESDTQQVQPVDQTNQQQEEHTT